MIGPIFSVSINLGPFVFPIGHSLTVSRNYLFRSEISSEGKYQQSQGSFYGLCPLFSSPKLVGIREMLLDNFLTCFTLESCQDT